MYRTGYSFGLGSRRVKIYNDGNVYDDLEIEEPNHVSNYTYLKTLTTDELSELEEEIKEFKSKPKATPSDLDSTDDMDEMDKYIIELVYGVKKFDIDGGY